MERHLWKNRRFRGTAAERRKLAGLGPRRRRQPDMQKSERRKSRRISQGDTYLKDSVPGDLTAEIFIDTERSATGSEIGKQLIRRGVSKPRQPIQVVHDPLFEFSVKTCTVIGVMQMAEFVQEHVVTERFGQTDQVQIKIDVSFRLAANPVR